MERARVVAVLKLRLGDRRLERDVPERGRLGPVRLAPAEVVQERPLRHPPRVVTDRGVQQRPVHGEADAPPHVLEGALVDLGEPLAQLDEVGPGDRYLASSARLLRRRERRVVRHRRVAAHAVDVLHPPLGRQPVVVPAERVEDRLAVHPLVAGHDVRVGVGKHVPDVQRPGHGGRRRVNGVHRLTRPGPVEPVYLVGLPAYAPYRLKSVKSGLVGDGGSAWLVGIGHVPTVLSGGERPSSFTWAR